MYIHTIKRPAKQIPAPSLHKDSDLGVPTSPLRFYLGGMIGGRFGKRTEVNKYDSLLLQYLVALTEVV